MTGWTYLGIALALMEVDALCTYATGTKYRPFASALMALIWPVSCIFTIGGVLRAQRGTNASDVTR